MKTTLEIHDSVLLRAKRLSKRTGKPLRALVEEGLRHVLESNDKASSFTLEDCSVGDAEKPNPLEAYSWQDLRSEIYGGEADR